MLLPVACCHLGYWESGSGTIETKLVGRGFVINDPFNPNNPFFGWSVAISTDGTTAIVGAPNDAGVGSAFVFVRTWNTWAQQGSKLTGTGTVAPSDFGKSVALSADGNTAIVGGPSDNSYVGAAWVFTRTNGVWTQQGAKLVGTGGTTAPEQGASVALSADGNTAIIGGPEDGVYKTGASWVFTRSGGVWTQQGNKLVGAFLITDLSTSTVRQGSGVALSADGNTALIGGSLLELGNRCGVDFHPQRHRMVAARITTRRHERYGRTPRALRSAVAGRKHSHGRGPLDNSGVGATWVFTRSGSTWTQQGSKLVGTGGVGLPEQGRSVSLSTDGNVALVGGLDDNSGFGAAWVFARNAGVWTQQGQKLVGSLQLSTPRQGFFVGLSGDGTLGIVGGPEDGDIGAAWVFAAPPCSLDIDGNKTIDPLTDGLMLVRAMFGLTGSAVTDNA
jgi:hypothetical protein